MIVIHHDDDPTVACDAVVSDSRDGGGGVCLVVGFQHLPESVQVQWRPDRLLQPGDQRDPEGAASLCQGAVSASNIRHHLVTSTRVEC